MLAATAANVGEVETARAAVWVHQQRCGKKWGRGGGISEKDDVSEEANRRQYTCTLGTKYAIRVLHISSRIILVITFISV